MTRGDRIPDLPVTIHTGEATTLGALQDGRPMVLFFYPKDGTPICTKEVCGFRDAYETFVDAGAVVVGISGDSVESHKAFASEHGLPYPLIADIEGDLREAFGVPRFLGFMDGRVTYVADRAGVVRHVFSARFMAERHVEEALSVVRGLVKGDA